jgi:hypothetical protein
MISKQQFDDIQTDKKNLHTILSEEGFPQTYITFLFHSIERKKVYSSHYGKLFPCVWIPSLLDSPGMSFQQSLIFASIFKLYLFSLE